MTDWLPPELRRILPPAVLAGAAVSSLVVALQLLMIAPELALLSASFAGAAGLQALGAYGLIKGRFWARGFGVGALLASSAGAGLWLTSAGVALSSTLLAALILLGDDAPGRYERRAAFLDAKQLDGAGARRLFYVSLALGVSLTALLGSSLSARLVLGAPAPTLLAAGLGALGLFGLTRLASWCYFAIVGAAVSLVVAIAMCALEGLEGVGGGAVLAAAFASATLPLTGPVVRALKGRS